MDRPEVSILLLCDGAGSLKADLDLLYPDRVEVVNFTEEQHGVELLHQYSHVVTSVQNGANLEQLDFAAVRAYAASGGQVIACLLEYAHDRGWQFSKTHVLDRAYPQVRIEVVCDITRGFRQGDTIPWYGTVSGAPDPLYDNQRLQRQILNPGGALSIEKSLERWNRRQAELDSAIIVESARWGHGHTRETWLAECDYVKEEFIAKSAEYLIPQLRKRGWFPLREAPLLEQGETTESGSVQVKFRGQGPIYYMLDNSDPRLPGGAPHTGAWILQPGDDGSELQEWLVEVPKDSRLKVRSWDAVEEDWSPLAELDTTVYGVPCDLKITELMYAPKVSTEAAMAGWSRDDLAWLELMNSGDNVLELDGFRFAEGITYTFPPFRLLAGERLVLAKNLEAFSTVYDLDGLQLLCGYSGNLARKGERLLLLSPEGETLLDFSYSNLWYPESDQGGYALVVVDTAAEQALWSTPENWKRGASPGGSPGTADEDEEFWPAQIVTQPLSQELFEGEPLTLCVAAVGVAPRLYQWFKDGASIPGATRSRFLLEAAEVSDSGSYGVWVSNAHGSALSQQVSIKVRSVPRVSYHYEGGSVLLRFTGTLYESRDLKDWQKVEGADGQLILDPSLGTRYYRSASEE